MENEGQRKAKLAIRPLRGRNWLLLAVLMLANFALALGAPLVRMTDTGPVSAAFWRMFLALPFLIVLARANGERLAVLPLRTALIVALGALAFAGDLGSWHLGIERTRLGNATLFANGGSIILMLWGFVAAWVLPRRLEWLAIICALAGAAMLMGRSLEISAETFTGDLFCIFAGLCYAVYLLSLRNERARFGSWSLLVWVSVFASPVLLLIAVALGEPVWPQEWTPIIALVLTSQVIGQGLMVYSLPHFPPLVIGLALLTQPAIAAAIGWSVFDETLMPLDIVGMLLLGGALVVAKASQRNLRPGIAAKRG